MIRVATSSRAVISRMIADISRVRLREEVE